MNKIGKFLFFSQKRNLELFRKERLIYGQYLLTTFLLSVTPITITPAAPLYPSKHSKTKRRREKKNGGKGREWKTLD